MGFKPQAVENFLGRGVTLPIVLDNGRWPVESGVNLIRKSIEMVIRWPNGDRFFLDEFGSRVEELIEEPNDDILAELAHTLIVDAISKWETRVEIMDVTIDRDGNSLNTNLNIAVTYKIVSSQRIDSFVFPFYPQINT